jgi:hypothetical protein
MASTLVTTGGTITLPEDMLWQDEFKWSPVCMAKSVTLSGSLIIEVGTQASGRLITLIGQDDGPWADTDTMDDLQAAEIAQGDTSMTLILPDGREFTVLFYQPAENQPAVEGDQVALRAPVDSTERSALQWIPTLRFIQVA